MRRREFITLVGGAAVGWPLTARAQQTAMPVVGLLSVGSPDVYGPYLAAYRQGLTETGFTEGQNVVIEYRWGNGDFNKMPALATDLVEHRVNVIVAGASTKIAKAATATIPIVGFSSGDPVRSGLVASLNRPGGNVTAVGLFTFSLGAKRFELLHELIPNTKTIAVLTNPNDPDSETKVDLAEVEVAARKVGQELSILNASGARDFEPAFTAMSQQGDGALLIMSDPLFFTQRGPLIALADRHAIPAIYEWREFAAEGGLMSYGSSLPDAYRQLGIYTGKILKGAKPADLPVMQAVKIELVLNLKTAKKLNLTFPITLLGRADEVIE
jgi:putative tryptophan/tyrosine transport system substrate-binding protein